MLLLQQLLDLNKRTIIFKSYIVKIIIKGGINLIDLNEIIEGLEYVNSCLDENVYYNTETKEVFYPDDLEYEDDDENLDEIMEKSIKLPSKYEINEYGMMQEFIETIENDLIYNKLLSAINGRGAFRRFKDTCIDFDIIDDWYKFRDEKYREIAINWCKENNIKFKE